MNEPLNSRDQQGDLKWVTESWNNSSTLGEGLEARFSQEGSRLDWDWENPPMILTRTGAGAGGCSDHGTEDQKPQVLSGPSMASSMKPYGCLLPSNFGSSSSHSNMELIEPSGLQPFGGLELMNHNLLNASNLHGVFGFSNFHGLPSANITSSELMFSNQQHNSLMGTLSMDETSSNNFMKPNDIYAAQPQSRIGLNLGVRTYFSTEDTIFGRLDRQPRANSPSSLQIPRCQAEGCKADLSRSKRYHRRHKVCEPHSKAANVVANGQNQRFCQQCSRFQPLSEFDEGKRSCRKRLADHNRRRRKPQPVASTSSAVAAAEPLPPKADEPGPSGASNIHVRTPHEYCHENASTRNDTASVSSTKRDEQTRKQSRHQVSNLDMLPNVPR